MKTLNFDSNDKYEIFYEALCVSELGYRGAALVVIGKVFDKMHALGEKKENEKGYKLSFDISQPNVIYPSIDLEDAEFELALQHYDSVNFSGLFAVRAGKVYEWLHSIK